jgi:recombination protein RecT
MALAATNTPAQIPGNVATQVLKQVMKLQSSRTLFIPADYSVENALRSAWFTIQNSEQKDKILNCTPESQANALYDMVLQALDVSKKQGYFIPYNQRLVFQRSYHGDIALAKRVRPGIEIYCEVVYKGEKTKKVKIRNRYGFITVVEKHELLDVRQGDIIEAYCGVVDENGEPLGDEIMTIEQIKTSWKKSKTFNPETGKQKFDNQGPTFHMEQPDVACLRTVVRRRLKAIINQSNDAALMESVRRSEMDAADAEIEEEVSKHANGDVITVHGATVEPPAAEQEPEVPYIPDQEPKLLTEAELRDKLKLTAGNWINIKDKLEAKGDYDLVEFVNGCVRDGATDFKGVTSRIEKLPDLSAEPEKAADQELPY